MSAWFAGTVANVLAEQLSTRPNAEAIVSQSGSFTYRQLDVLANRAANALRALGIAPADRVAASLPSDIEIIAAFHGAMRVGAIWTGVAEGLTAAEKSYILGDAGATLLLCTPEIAEQVAGMRDELPALRLITSCGSSVAADHDWTELTAGQSSDPISVEIDPHAPAAIAYTSGTTGFPKGAVHSQHNMLLPGWYLAKTRGYDHTLRKGDCFPLTILNMLVLTTVLTAQVGGTAVIMESLRSDTVVEWVRREQVHVWNGPPPVLYTLAHDDSVPPSDLASLREVWSGGAECPRAIREAFETKFQRRIYSTYGQTEVPTTIAMELLTEDHIPGMTGRPLPHFDLTIRGSDDAPLALGGSGEICIAPNQSDAIRAAFTRDWSVELEPGVDPPLFTPMLGYWGRPEESAKALRGGMLHTGDAAAYDAYGNLRFTDRLSLVLNRGGANVYPAEIERVTLEIEEVEACAVFGVPDERLGQRVAMLVQFSAHADPDVGAVLDHCRAGLAAYKVPEFIGVVDAFPRNAMGKIDRKAVTRDGGQQVERVQTPA